ncbi:peptidase associated domain and porin domain-containing protein [Filimonas effusa]|uniref:Uncharacterized protein n=1 Tax=Filimonas effusa TaxID=2508721 RepID=A0A4Q1D5P1_9BACT|nr:outer membrane beta-barrel protein [Filimonas effusa]RXK83872.1 hypothetical protein ESB13_17535 [Filimonas effusa]
MRKAILLTCCACYSLLVFAQTDSTGNIGIVKGKAKDSVYNFMLTSATVAVYLDSDSSLIQFSLPDNFGEFTIGKLPLGKRLRLIISHVGYTTFLKKFSLSNDKKELDLGLLYLFQAVQKDGNTLEEVIVKSVPPMRMNGDTVEFNADAFRMDVNATAEDLMRRLPGFTVWGDGEITYNGKKINAVMVEGKPFMGTNDPAIATRNLPKEALDKIQVYQQRDEKNPLDSTMFANIRLKDDKKMGYFGKLSGSLGTDGRYAADGMLSGFNRKLQINTVGALNNINKLAPDIDVLVKNGSYKGEGANADYQSDFSMRGLNKTAAAGAKMQYDFIPEVEYRRTSRINADYFLKGNNSLINNTSLFNSFLEADTVLSKRSVQVADNKTWDQKMNGKYTWNSERTDLVLTASLNRGKDNSLSETHDEQDKTGVGAISSSVSRIESETKKNRLDIGLEYTNRDNDWNMKKRIAGDFTVGYRFSAESGDGYSRNQSQFISNIHSSDNKEFDRIFEQRNAHSGTHTITARYPGLTRLFFNKRSFSGIQMGLSGSLILKNEDYTDKVTDRDAVTKEYNINNYLTNNRELSTFNLQPVFYISKNFQRTLTNRYNKWVSFSANFRNQYFNFDHRSRHNFQNISYKYSYFVPDAAIEYYNHQYGSYELRFNLDFSTSVTYPGINSLAPLVDSSNLWYIHRGNLMIKPQYKKELSLGGAFTTRKSKNQLRFDATVKLGKINNSFADSTLYNKEGVRTVYTVNVDGNKFVNIESGIRKYIEIRKNTTLEVNGRYSINISEEPQYVNNTLNTSIGSYQNLLFYLGFGHKDLLNVKTEAGLRIYNSRQEGFDNNSFKSTNSYLRLITALQFPKHFAWNTNLTYNKSNSNNSDALYFTIWNASLSYRFLKGNNAEIKLAALDILRQNKGIVNTASANSQTLTTSNVLQQYYMITLSYYPRKFGKKE